MTEWKSTDDWMPPGGKRVLVFVKDDAPHIEISTFNLALYKWEGFEGKDITHWVEMPGFPPVIKPESSIQLSEKRQQELLAHLIDKFDEEYAVFCVFSLASDMEEFSSAGQYIDWEFSDYRKRMDASQAAHRLYRLCRDTPGIEKYFPTCWALSSDLAKQAQAIREEIPEKRGKGRPPATRCRDELIRRIYGHYPEALRKKSINSHFEKTVEMILRWVEPMPPDDIHAAVIRALGKKNDFQ